eukprot:GGOE01000336.1.p1 GENE.GGOE01000336.1~~GGOE01000336.1.p1  ORF type:complete len:469 (-),score=108.97 GGOE01000336.1:520-1926(-)
MKKSGADDDCCSELSISPRMACTIRPALGMSMSLSISAMPSSLRGNASLDSVRKELMTARSKLEKLCREQGEHDTPMQIRTADASKAFCDPASQHQSQLQHPPDIAAPSDMLALLRSKMKKLLQEEEVAEQRRQAAVECILQSKGPFAEQKPESPERPHSRPGAARRSSLLTEDALVLQCKRPSTCPLKGSQGSMSRLCFPSHPALPGPRGDIEAADPFGTSVISPASELEEPRLPAEVPYCTYSPLRLDGRSSFSQKKASATNGFASALNRKSSLGLSPLTNPSAEVVSDDAGSAETAPSGTIAEFGRPDDLSAEAPDALKPNPPPGEEVPLVGSAPAPVQSPDKATPPDEGMTYEVAKEQFIAMLKTRLAQKATKLPQRPLSKEEAEQLDIIQCRWAELTWASPEVLDRQVNTPGRGAIMGRRRSAATRNQTLDAVEAAEQWQRHEIQKEGARQLGVLYRQLLEDL